MKPYRTYLEIDYLHRGPTDRDAVEWLANRLGLQFRDMVGTEAGMGIATGLEDTPGTIAFFLHGAKRIRYAECRFPVEPNKYLCKEHKEKKECPKC